MRYDREKELLVLSVRELVSTARRGISSTLPCDSDEPESLSKKVTRKGSGDSTPDLIFDFSIEEHSFRLISSAKTTDTDKILIEVPTDTSPTRPRKELTLQARGEGCISAFMLAKKNSLARVSVTYIYFNTATGERNEVYEQLSFSKLEKFFEKCKISIIIYAKPEIERVTKRLPSMKAVKFPYEKVRSGQGEIIRGVYKNVARGGRLFVSAPTGTGKTMSVIFPAIRALGDEKCEKVFYFTPKTTTAEAAKDALNDIARAGADIRALLMSSKERLCRNGLVCRENRARCKNAEENRLADAVLALYEQRKTVVTPNEAREIAEKYGVCPHELSLSYAELCDVVILDVNYLFDPAVYIRRFFSERGEYAFLIDEAHNLPDRAREIYSANLSEHELVSPYLSPIITELSPLKNATRVATEQLSALFMPYLKENLTHDENGEAKSATHLSEPPVELYTLFEDLLPLLENEIYKNRAARDEDAEQRGIFLRDYYRMLKKFYDALLSFDSSYELFVFMEGNEITVRIFCLDPGREISKRLDKGGSAVFFSGTLSPIYYYKSVLGGDRTAEVIESESSFDSGQLSVSIMDKISTRLSERERTLAAVCRAIAATVSAKRGNYMIFSPSFAYSEALAKFFSAKYPKIKVISQRSDMTKREKEEFLSEFRKEDKSYLVGFSVLGGIYSEGIDFSGESLIGAVIIGIGIPSLSYEREAMTAYYQDRFEEGKQFAYIYPGINKVLQAAGRVIRSETDRGVIVLIDDRFDDPLYKTVIPKLWSGMEFVDTPAKLRERLDLFWSENTAHGDIK